MSDKQFRVQLVKVEPGLSYPFIAPGGTEAYCQSPPAGVRWLQPGEMLKTDSGGFSFDDLRMVQPQPGDLLDHFKLALTVYNKDGGYEPTLMPSGGLLTTEGLQSRIQIAGSSGARAGPLQTVHAYLRSSYELPERATMPKGAWFALEGIPYYVGGDTTKGQTYHQPVIVCFP